MRIQAILHDCWRRAHEGNNKEERDEGLFGSRRPRTPLSGQGSSEDRQDVWDADLRVGKRQSGGKETLNFSNGYRPHRVLAQEM